MKRDIGENQLASSFPKPVSKKNLVEWKISLDQKLKKKSSSKNQHNYLFKQYQKSKIKVTFQAVEVPEELNLRHLRFYL